MFCDQGLGSQQCSCDQDKSVKLCDVMGMLPSPRQSWLSMLAIAGVEAPDRPVVDGEAVP